ncbi:purine-binding chemotaxis protein CheW [Azospirillum fermentarium]|uniref:chemotaxis protein CheW n=1 Tax=Azospirillum fermentarium TaxID=1233114 RepID=UPI0022271BDC|nr:chemotaxis protein CheW [Azospirillum fermentarium]MCW2246655.1 purine-binding chemotaxis protein CheW [Azospirillum fermentarium]
MSDAAVPPPAIVFDVSGHRLSLPAAAVVRVLPLPRLDRLPASPAVIAGLFRYGTALVPALYLDVLLGLPAALPGLYRPLLLCRRPGGMTAYLCDRVVGLVTPPSLAPLPQPNGGMVPLSFNRCVAGRFEHGGAVCLLLDPARLLTAAEEQSLDAHRRIAEERAAVWTDTPVWPAAAEDAP